MKKDLILWPALVIIGAVLAAGTFLVVKPPLGEWVGTTTDKNTQVVNAITRSQEIALVTLGIEGIRERKTENGQFLFLSIPNSRAAFLRYSFDAKLGIDASEVTIDEQPDGSFLVSIPAFIVIGLNNQNIEVAAESNDVLSWTTPEIDKVAMVNDVFGDELQAEYLARNEELLRDQARVFYTNIAAAIDPEANLKFEFAPAAPPSK
ncbi:hypothetical protein [uncultured Microbacterium sp.]|uniref:hypothetical protein n=1 Tax=Microbacterium algeriense TaxID=2615184 RepID=UPI002597F5B2|nr:hypothetical protein [uncultured Microbacterium sp.]